MKLSVCSHFILVILSILLANQSYSDAEAVQYSVGDKIYLADQYSQEGIPYSESDQYYWPHDDEAESLAHHHHQQHYHQQHQEEQDPQFQKQQQQQFHHHNNHPDPQQQQQQLYHHLNHQAQQQQHQTPQQYRPSSQPIQSHANQQLNQHDVPHLTTHPEQHLQRPQQHLHHYHHQQQQQNQPELLQQPQQNQQRFDEQATNIQQVSLLNTPAPTYVYSHSQIGWKHESTPEGEVNAVFISRYESFPVIGGIDATDSCDPRPSMFIQFNVQQQFCKTTSKPPQNSNIESYPLVPQHPYDSSLFAAISHYWREISGLCLASAIFLNWLFVVVKRKFFESSMSNRSSLAVESTQQPVSRSVSKDTNSSTQDSAFEETVSPISLEDIDSSKSSSDHQYKSSTTSGVFHRQRSSTLKAEPIPIRNSPRNSSSLSNSPNTSEYNSRYSSDFDSIQRLGRGGFGIVFEAKNKIDDCHYAVKRICLPMEKEARERVMREVKALAKLDHVGIVRYYNAWLETPPDEWLKAHDAQLGIVNSNDGMGFPSTDGIYERYESKRSSGYRKFLKNNSSSPSLDIVFEGSGSLRLEAENNDNDDDDDFGHKNAMLMGAGGDNPSDSEDNDFLQFKSKRKDNGDKNEDDDDDFDFSTPSHWTEPFSSSSSNDSGSGDNNAGEPFSKEDIVKSVNMIRKHGLAQQKKLRQLNNVPSAENLHADKVYLYIQMQLCRKDTLKDWLKTNCEHRDKTVIFDLFYQIVDAVEYVHSQDLIHRDLKPSNIFFSLDGTLKIGDFGLCRAKTAASGIGSSLDLQEYVAESDVERCFEAVHTEQVGTQLYMSPEQLNGLSYNQKVDIFAMGLILLELLVPFKTQMQRVNVLFKARNNLYSDEFKSDHPQEHELVKSLLCRSPQRRPTATEIKQHTLLSSAQLSEPVIERIYNTRRRTISSNSSTE